MSPFCERATKKKQLTSVQSKKAASSSCHPSRRRMRSSVACVGQACATAASGKQCNQFNVTMGPLKSRNSRGDLDPHLIYGSSDPQD